MKILLYIMIINALKCNTFSVLAQNNSTSTNDNELAETFLIGFACIVLAVILLWLLEYSYKYWIRQSPYPNTVNIVERTNIEEPINVQPAVTRKRVDNPPSYDQSIQNYENDVFL